ncbi:MAG TPA: glycosyltransferase 87 family protein, partial [Gaiellaceae bacterium]|nr:glycosyltransferase 87 family protein [Gaiellaceae bacterium]
MPSSRPEEPSPDAVWIAIAIVLGLATLLWSWAALHTEHWQRYELIDIGVYERYGDAIVDGELPYRDFGPEYPPLSLAVFVLPAAIVGAGAAEAEFGDTFELTMLACGIALVLVSAATLVSLGASPLRLCVALGLVGATPLLLGSVILTRFDLWPALLTGAALLGFVRGRGRVGSGLLGAAVAAKLYPLALAPVALAFVWRRKGRREAVWCAAVIAAV